MRSKYDNLSKPPAHRVFKVGDSVANGAHQEAEVTAVHDDGMSYDLEVRQVRQREGSQKVTLPKIETRENILWTEVLPLSSRDQTVEQFSNNKYYPLTYQQRDIGSLISMVYSEYGFDFDPDYQRELVWNIEDKISLIDSIMAKRDIGKFVLNHREWHETKPLTEIIDGKQRLTAIKEFYEDQFKYRGKFFSELHPRDKNTFENKAVSVALLDNATYEEILETFVAVNTTGKPQDVDHLNKVKTELETRKGN